MLDLKTEKIECYLRQVLGQPLEVLRISQLGEASEERSLKEYGYGTPLEIDYVIGGERGRAVIHTMHPGPFGHEHMADRAQELLWEAHAFNHLPRHVRSFDVGGFAPDGALRSLGNVEEFFLLTEYVEGSGYFLDLARIQDTDELTDLDLARVDALSRYLAEIHATRGGDPGLYVRRIRELVGHGECIMGLADSYPDTLAFPTPQILEQIECLCIPWRWKLKRFTHRLRQVHGDFHPWNILFQSGAAFRLLDRSRGEYGDPADDVASLAMNYVFSSLQRSGRVDGAFAALLDRFWNRYLEQTGDLEMLDVIAPFLVFRALVMASPVWYPRLPVAVRRALFTFMRSVLEAKRFELQRINEYCRV
jgi:phosphotransferase family enzyme